MMLEYENETDLLSKPSPMQGLSLELLLMKGEMLVSKRVSWGAN